MSYCLSCGISLEIDFDDEDGQVCAQCKALRPNCEHFEIVDWDEDTQEIYHAVCTISSDCWPNCNRCQKKVEYKDV